MKISVIGDVHGSQSWKKIVDKELFNSDKIVFVGDYFDSFNHTVKQQIKNFREIVALKNTHPENVVLLLGNHDFHYTRHCTDIYSGFSHVMRLSIIDELQRFVDDDVVQICFAHSMYNKNFLISHAGITNTWLKSLPLPIDNTNIFDIEDEINYLFKEGPKYFNFKLGENKSFAGDDITQGPLWVRPNSLRQDGISNCTQIVGHTRTNIIDIKSDIIQVDVLMSNKQYLIIDNSKLIVEKF